MRPLAGALREIRDAGVRCWSGGTGVHSVSDFAMFAKGSRLPGFPNSILPLHNCDNFVDTSHALPYYLRCRIIMEGGW